VKIRPLSGRSPAALVLTLLALFASSARAQDGCWSINLIESPQMLVYNTNDLTLHFVPAIRRWFRQRKRGYVHPTTYISKILNRISSNVIAVPCDSSQETALRGYAESRTDGNRADPSRECSYPG
jgi:hypothetical protein